MVQILDATREVVYEVLGRHPLRGQVVHLECRDKDGRQAVDGNLPGPGFGPTSGVRLGLQPSDHPGPASHEARHQPLDDRERASETPGIADQSDQALHRLELPDPREVIPRSDHHRRRPLPLAGRDRMLNGRVERPVLRVPCRSSPVQIRLEIWRRIGKLRAQEFREQAVEAEPESRGRRAGR